VDLRSQQFLAIMIAIAALAILAFIAFFINARVRAAKSASQQEAAGQPVFWHEFILATVVIVIAAAALVWQFTPDSLGWEIDNRRLIFLIVMLAAGVIALVAFVVALFTGLRPGAVELRSGTAEAGRTGTGQTAQNASGTKPVSVGIRLLGLLALIVAFLVLNWTALDKENRYALVTSILYPAAITLSLVLLMDKATRSWAAKTSAENFREWLFCDAIVFLLILAFLNLRQIEETGSYQTLFWDVLQVTLFILVFWLVDRTASSLRFLFAYLYLVALPILLLIWRTVQGLEMPGALSWWESIWPFFFLAVIFFVLELVTVVASRETPRHGLSAAKDLLFVIIYGILLLAAIPSAQG
jgi:hypothetical protein